MSIKHWFDDIGKKYLNPISEISKGTEINSKVYIFYDDEWVDFDKYAYGKYATVDTVRLIGNHLHLIEFKDQPFSNFSSGEELEKVKNKYIESKIFFDKIEDCLYYRRRLVCSLEKNSNDYISSLEQYKIAFESECNCILIDSNKFINKYKTYLTKPSATLQPPL